MHKFLKYLKELWDLYGVILMIALMIFLWIPVSRLDSFLLTTFYPLYVSIILAGAAMVKYRHQTLSSVPLKYKKLELITTLMIAVVLLLITLNLRFALALDFALCLIAYLTIGVALMNAWLLYKSMVGSL